MALNDPSSLRKRILLVRHGETEWNQLHRFQGRLDIPLNENGRTQASALAHVLKAEALTAIYSSPLARAIETAHAVRAFHSSVPFFTEEGLMEMDLGEFDGMDARRWRAEYPAFHECWRLTPGSTKMPGGECLNDVQIRAVNALMRLSEPYEPGSTLLLCGHNFVNITILCFALEIPLDRFRELRQEPTALNILYREGDHLRAESINDTSHLNGLRVHASTIHK